MPAKDQISITVTAQEREIIEKIANKLGRQVASVLRECAMDGLPNVIEKYSSMEKILDSD